MKKVVVTGEEVGVGVIGHRKLLHGACLDQLQRDGTELGLCAVLWRPGHTTQMKALTVHTEPGATAALQVPPLS